MDWGAGMFRRRRARPRSGGGRGRKLEEGLVATFWGAVLESGGAGERSSGLE